MRAIGPTEPSGPAARERAARLGVLSDRLLQMGLDGRAFGDVLGALAEGLNGEGLSINRIHVSLRSNHPEFGSMALRWLRKEGMHQENFERRATPLQRWLQSPLYHLLALDTDELRQRLDVPDPDFDFPFFDELRMQGGTDYILFKRLFNRADGTLSVDPDAPPEGALISLSTDAAGGFADSGLEIIRAMMPATLLALKSYANRQMAKDIADTYLGKDAGGRVVSGDIIRGSVQQMQAVIAYFDLSGFTRLSEELEGRAMIDMLNAYFEMVVDVVHGHGGDVLKFMGDGLLAVFDCARVEDANATGVAAAIDLRARMAGINAMREQAGAPTTGFTLALHGGEVLYGNIGGRNRLDFTVIGPAVNTAARLSGMCAHVDQNIVISANVARPVMSKFEALVSLGTYRLRGVAERQELFTLD